MVVDIHEAMLSWRRWKTGENVMGQVIPLNSNSCKATGINGINLEQLTVALPPTAWKFAFFANLVDHPSGSIATERCSPGILLGFSPGKVHLTTGGALRHPPLSRHDGSW